MAVDFADKVITEITCHAQRRKRIGREETATIIDVGGSGHEEFIQAAKWCGHGFPDE